MNARRGESPERLLEGDATAFERRLLEKARAHGPSKELTQRMAKALGVSVTTLAAPPSAAAPTAAPSAPALASGVTSAWVSATVIALSVTGIVVGMRAKGPRHPATPAVQVDRAAVAPPQPAPGPDVVPTPETTRGNASGLPKTSLVARAAPDLRGEIELVDEARIAASENAFGRALEIIRRYETRYPTGSFVPEATAVKVEALVRLGRAGEARALAARFVASHRGTVLGDRVAAMAGLPTP